MKTIQVESTFNKDAKLHIEAYKDNEKTLDCEGKSFTINFMQALYTRMTANYSSLLAPSDYYVYVKSITESRIYLAGNPTANGGALYLSYVFKVNDEFILTDGFICSNILLKVTNVVNEGYYNGYIDYQRVDGVPIPAFSYTYASPYPKKISAKTIKFNTEFNKRAIFQDAKLIVGELNGTTVLTDAALKKENNTIVYNAQIISDISNDVDSAYFTITKSFTNNSGAAINIGEIGLLTSFAYPDAAYQNSISDNLYTKVLTARDALASVQNVANQKTITFNYKIRNVLGASGGFLKSFVNDLRLLFGRKDGGKYAAYFYAMAGGNDNFFAREYDCPLKGNDLGLVVGSGSSVLITDTTLGVELSKDVIQYDAMRVETPLTISGNEAYFTLSRIIQNKSANPVTINELGLKTLKWDGWNSDANYTTANIELISKHLLTNFTVSQKTLDPNEYMKILYKVRLVV